MSGDGFVMREWSRFQMFSDPLATLGRIKFEAAARKHNELLTVVIGAGRIFLEEHARQTFRPVALAPFPHPQNAVLKPLLQRPVGETDAWLATQWHVLYPPCIAPIADLALMVGRLWHERRATEPAEEITVPELEPIEEPAPAFAEADAYGRSRPDVRWQCLMRPPTLPRQCACCCWR
jgi:hypothetical protein